MIASSVALFAGRLLAADSTSTQQHPNPILPSPNELVFGFISFVVVAAFIVKYALPRLRETLAERTASIEGKMQQAERDRQEAADLLARYRADIAAARDEAQRIVEAANRDAVAIAAEGRERAREEAERIVSAASAAVAAERQAVLASLRREIGGLSVDLAERILGSALRDDERQDQLIDAFISGLESGTGTGTDPVAPTPAPAGA